MSGRTGGKARATTATRAVEASNTPVEASARRVMVSAAAPATSTARSTPSIPPNEASAALAIGSARASIASAATTGVSTRSFDPMKCDIEATTELAEAMDV
jgi:hypothetical protein